MFTGIIQATGSVVKLRATRHGRFVVIKTDPHILSRVVEGESVSVDGVCLTAIMYIRDTLQFELMGSTLKLTTLGARKVGDRINIEPALVVGQPFGGHFVLGHVDGVGVIKNVKCKMKNGTLITVSVPNQLAHYIVPQGSITVNGVSLTVVDVGDVWFSVALTQYTATHTNLGALKVSDSVNIETDMFAKYIINFLNHYGSYEKVSRRRGKI